MTIAKVLCVIERAGDGLDESAWELLGAGRSLAGDGGLVTAVVLGENLDNLARELGRGFDEVFVFDDPALAVWNGHAYSRVLAPLVAREAPALTLAMHTNLGIDLAPGLAARAGVPLLADCLGLRATDSGYEATRAVYGGKVHARVVCTAGDRGVLATLRAGAVPAAEPGREPSGTIRTEQVPEDVARGRRFVRTADGGARDVDITQAPILVGVGRGIEDEENLELVRSLADALGAEIACSRPVVDKGWLPKSRQVGTSGVTVKPKVYIALGISGSFQHIGGIKGSPFLIAVNKDSRAPIFGIADLGVVGDIMEIAPALEAKLRETR
jgi:electron transfer flavoprotein alpha subunit